MDSDICDSGPLENIASLAHESVHALQRFKQEEILRRELAKDGFHLKRNWSYEEDRYRIKENEAEWKEDEAELGALLALYRINVWNRFNCTDFPGLYRLMKYLKNCQLTE